jgi:fibronectin type 3 domain-containing protein
MVVGPASPKGCVTAKDTFPPAAPKNLEAIAAVGAINLIWDANTEADVAGYLVLRGEATGATLQALTATPVPGSTYNDTTVTAGARYVYAVVAVDKATPQNVSAQSNRVEETAR